MWIFLISIKVCLENLYSLNLGLVLKKKKTTTTCFLYFSERAYMMKDFQDYIHFWSQNCIILRSEVLLLMTDLLCLWASTSLFLRILVSPSTFITQWDTLERNEDSYIMSIFHFDFLRYGSYKTLNIWDRFSLCLSYTHGTK